MAMTTVLLIVDDLGIHRISKSVTEGAISEVRRILERVQLAPISEECFVLCFASLAWEIAWPG